MTLNGNSKEKIKSLKYDILDIKVQYLNWILLLILSRNNILILNIYHLYQIFQKNKKYLNHKKEIYYLEFYYN